MSYYNECPLCSASLDPNEICDCQAQKAPMQSDLTALVTSYVGPVSQDEISASIEPAMEKLHYIISREGDAEGKRLNPEYIAQLMAEHIREARFSAKCEARYNEKRHAAEADAPYTTNMIAQTLFKSKEFFIWNILYI